MNKPLLGEHKVRKRKLHIPGNVSKADDRFMLQFGDDNLQQYLNAGPFIFLVLDADGKLRLINKKGCEILGYRDKNEIIGKNWFNNFAPSGKKNLYRKIFTRIIENDTDSVSRGYREGPVLRKDGKVSHVKWSYTIFYNEKGKPGGMICSGEDVSDKK